MLDKISISLKGDGNGNGPVADVVNSGAAIAGGNGEKIKSALGQLSNALRLSADGGAQTQDQLTTIVRNLSSLLQAAADNDAKLRDFGTTVRQLSQIVNDEDFGSGTTGKTMNTLLAQVGDFLEKNRDNIKAVVNNGSTTANTLLERQRDLAEFLDVAPLTLDNMYNVVDQNNGAARAQGARRSGVVRQPGHQGDLQHDGLAPVGVQHRHIAGLRTGLRADVCPRRYGCDGAEMKRAIAILVVAVGATACSSNGLSSLPLPAPTVGSGGYRLTAVFSNALNLPASAKVKLAGADVGQMETMVARNYTAVTTIRIMDGVRLPQGTTVELRSATPLGDVFIALKPPAGASATTPLLKDGDTIGLDSTTAAATVESVLSSSTRSSGRSIFPRSVLHRADRADHAGDQLFHQP